MHKNQRGLGIVPIILIVAVVAVAGLITWRLTSTASGGSRANSPTEQSQPQTQEPPSLSIKEWGVKIPLSQVTAGAYYTLNYDVQQSATNPGHLVIYSKDIDALVGPKGVTCNGEYIAHIMRLRKDDPQWQPKQNIDDGKVSSLFINRTDIGDFRYAVSTYRGYGAECFDASEDITYEAEPTISHKFRDIAQAFADDFKNIKTN